MNAHKITRKLPIPNHLVHGAIHAAKLLPSSFRRGISFKDPRSYHNKTGTSPIWQRHAEQPKNS